MNKWYYYSNEIRWKKTAERTYEFQVFKRPYFFGKIGKKIWETIVVHDNLTLDIDDGMTFCVEIAETPKDKLKEKYKIQK